MYKYTKEEKLAIMKAISSNAELLAQERAEQEATDEAIESYCYQDRYDDDQSSWLICW